MAYNTIAEIPGGDLKEEIVMLGAHLDSWHAGTGATDNGAGVAVVMEAVRILKRPGLQAAPHGARRALDWRRAGACSVRRPTCASTLATISGDGGRGEQATKARRRQSERRGNVAQRSQSARTLVREPDYDKFSAYFNLDNGSGRIRGIFAKRTPAPGPSSATGWRRSATWMPKRSPWPPPAAPITCRSTPSACPGFSSFRTRSST